MYILSSTPPICHLRASENISSGALRWRRQNGQERKFGNVAFCSNFRLQQGNFMRISCKHALLLSASFPRITGSFEHGRSTATLCAMSILAGSIFLRFLGADASYILAIAIGTTWSPFYKLPVHILETTKIHILRNMT